MHLLSGTVRDLVAQLSVPDGIDRMVAACATRLRRRYGHGNDSEQTSWTNSWPRLLNALHHAGLDDLHLFLELELPACSERADAVLLGVRPDGGLTAVVIELKQWTSIDTTTSTRTQVLGHEYTHPCAQAAGYVHHLREWLDAGHLDLEVTGVAVLHDAGAEVGDRLRAAVAQAPGSGAIEVLCAPDLRRPASELAKAFMADHLSPPSSEIVDAFVACGHRPSEPLLARVAEAVNGNRQFRLLGAQQDAHLAVLDKVAHAGPGERHLIVVSGGPGTGKSVVALRLLADIPRSHPQEHDLKARYVTTSGTLRQQLVRAVDVPGSNGLFVYLNDHVRSRPRFPVVSLVDEAQRMKRSGNYLEALMAITRVCVVFLDEKQIIRPDEGLTVTDCEAMAARLGAKFHHVELKAQFRCAGSLEYLTWLENLLYAQPAITRKELPYDISVAPDPEDLARWTAGHTNRGYTARISAGFCWEWPRVDRSQPLNEDVDIPWTDSHGRKRVWRRPWNASEQRVSNGKTVAPARVYWATDDGGENQVGCIYTCQGLEYDYAGVILGPDFVRRGEQWIGRPECSKDGIMRGLSRTEYTRLATNIYYVLASRGIRGCRLYSTDEETQNYLTTMMRPSTA